MRRQLAAGFDGEVAGGAVADFFFVISSSGRDDGARSAERPARAALRQPTAVADSFFVISSSGRDDGARSAERPARAALRQPTAVADFLFRDFQFGARRWSSVSRTTRSGRAAAADRRRRFLFVISSSGRDDGARSAERPARAALRQPTAVADSFFVISSSGRDDGARSAERPARAALRQPTAVADSFFVILVWGGRWSAMMAARRRGFGAGRAQRGRGSSPRMPNSAALTLGRSASRSPGCAGRCSERSAEFGSVNHVLYPHSRARGWAARCHLICATCSIGLAGAAAAGRRIRW